MALIHMGMGVLACVSALDGLSEKPHGSAYSCGGDLAEINLQKSETTFSNFFSKTNQDERHHVTRILERIGGGYVGAKAVREQNDVRQVHGLAPVLERLDELRLGHDVVGAELGPRAASEAEHVDGV